MTTTVRTLPQPSAETALPSESEFESLVESADPAERAEGLAVLEDWCIKILGADIAAEAEW